MADGHMIRCDRCGRSRVFVGSADAVWPTVAAYAEAKRHGWRWYDGIAQFFCPDCFATAKPPAAKWTPAAQKG